MSELELKRIIEALLFASGEPLSTERIFEALKDDAFDKKQIEKAIRELSDDYAALDLSFKIIEVKDGFMLVTKPQFANWIKKLTHKVKTARLSQAALETIAIVAYKGPITRVQIDDIRGISSFGVVATLLKRGLIKVVGREDVPGRPMLYDVTDKFYFYFGIKSRDDLPRLREIEEIVNEAS